MYHFPRSYEEAEVKSENKAVIDPLNRTETHDRLWSFPFSENPGDWIFHNDIV